MVQEYRNNIQRAFIGQGPFKLAPEWKSLEVSEVAWMTKTPEERRRHMAKADPYAASFTPASLACSTKCDEAVEDSNEDEVVIIGETSTNTASDTANFLCNFDDTGLPVHLNGSWNNARKILDLSGVGEFPGNDAKRVVISLTSGICHTVSCGGPLKKPNSCDDQCQGFISKGICAHMIAVASYNGCLESYLSSYRARISTIVKSLIPATTGKKENQKRQRKRKQNDLRDVSSSKKKTKIAGLIGEMTTWRLFSSVTPQLVSAMAALHQYAQSHQKIHHQHLTIYSYEERNTEFTTKKDQQRCTYPETKNLCITTRLRHV